MKPRLSKEQKKQKMVVDMINKMFEIAGHPVTFDDVKDRKDNWYTQWTMTMEQNDEWNDDNYDGDGECKKETTKKQLVLAI